MSLLHRLLLHPSLVSSESIRENPEYSAPDIAIILLPQTVFTAAQAFYLRLGLPRPDQDNSKVAGKWILVWSGSTAVGQ